MKAYQPSKDETAFLYQQAFELEPMVKNLGSLTVLVEEIEKKKTEPHHFAVTFVVAPESMQLSIRGTGDTIVEATMAAKDETRRQLSELMNSFPIDMMDRPQWLH